MVAYSEDNMLGDASLTNWKAKQSALLPSSKLAALKAPPVMSAKSRPVKVFTPFVLPPMLVKVRQEKYGQSGTAHLNSCGYFRIV